MRELPGAESGRLQVLDWAGYGNDVITGQVGLPTTYLIAKDGKIAWMLTGSFLEEREALERATDQSQMALEKAFPALDFEWPKTSAGRADSDRIAVVTTSATTASRTSASRARR